MKSLSSHWLRKITRDKSLGLNKENKVFHQYSKSQYSNFNSTCTKNNFIKIEP